MFDGFKFARPLAAAAALCAALAGSRAEAVVIDFDAYIHGTPISNQYQGSGVLFSTNGGGPCSVFGDPPEATSQPNILIGADVYSDIFLLFVDPATGAPSPVAGDCVTLNVISAGHAVVHVRSRNAANAILEDFTVTNPGGPVNGLGNVDHIEFTTGPIATVEMVFTLINLGDGIGIDDVTIGSGCVTATRPSSWGAVKATYR